MENPEDDAMKKNNNPAPGSVAPADIESQPSAPAGQEDRSSAYTSIVRRWRREDLLKKGQVVLRTIALVFSVLSFLIMVANKHSTDWENFDKYEEYRYLVAISTLSIIYTVAQVLRQIHEFSTAKYLISRQGLNLLDFFGDQFMAYMLMSAASTAIPMTNRMREGADNVFTDSSSASISMAFFSFIAMALSALISGYKLSTQTYI